MQKKFVCEFLLTANWGMRVCMVSWLDVRSDLNVYASCDLRYLGVSCEMVFAFLFLILNTSLFCGSLPLSLEILWDILLGELWSEFKINFLENLVHFEGRLIYRTKKRMVIWGNYASKNMIVAIYPKVFAFQIKLVKNYQLIASLPHKQ